MEIVEEVYPHWVAIAMNSEQRIPYWLLVWMLVQAFLVCPDLSLNKTNSQNDKQGCAAAMVAHPI